MKNDHGNPEILTFSSHVSQKLKQTIITRKGQKIFHSAEYALFLDKQDSIEKSFTVSYIVILVIEPNSFIVTKFCLNNTFEQ